MAQGQYDTLDPYGQNYSEPEPEPVKQPLKTSQFPWTDADINDVRQFSTAWRAEHGVTQGKAGDLEIAYQQLRMQGLDHDAARQGAINQLGWQGDTQQAAPTPPSSGPSAPSTTTGGLTDPFTQTFTRPDQVNLGGPTGIPYVPQTPTYTAPSFQAPKFTPPPEFSYKDFQGPDAQSVLNAPGYQFRLNEGERALTNTRAAQGLLGTGSTLKDILGYGQDYASNEFSNEWNRELTGYQTNRSNAVDTYNTNYGTQYVDPYKFAYQGAMDAFAPQMAQFQANVTAGNLGYSTQAAAGQHESDQRLASAWDQYLFDYNNKRNRQLDTFNMQSSVLGQ